ncbi:tRNA ligase [Thoreauomyces humboldtii]|nr:tRNA ligase [Thoreauomyces humboldtii]
MSNKKQTTLGSFFGGKSAPPPKSPAKTNDKKKAVDHTPNKIKQAVVTATSDVKVTSTDSAAPQSASTKGHEKENIESPTEVSLDGPQDAVQKELAGKESSKDLPQKRKVSEDGPRATKKLRRRAVVSDSDDTETDDTPTAIPKSAERSASVTPITPESAPTSTKGAAKRENETSDQDEEDEEAEAIEEIAEAKMLTNDLLNASTDLTWPQNGKVPYAALCKTFEKIEGTTKRLMISEFLTKFFLQVIRLSPKDLVACVYLCLNRIGPEYEGKELGIGESILIKAVGHATGRTPVSVKADLAEAGDLGTVAQASKQNQKIMYPPPPLTVSGVLKTLTEISNIAGQASQAAKIAKINKLVVACVNNEPKYLIRSLEGKLRIGLAEQTVLTSLAHAAALATIDKSFSSEKRIAVLAEAASTLKHVYNELPNYDEIVPALLKHGIKDLPDHCKLRPGVPLKPMLAHPTKSLTDVLNRFEKVTFTCEYKYDGERAQIHLMEDGTTHIYSRNSENLSPKYPDIIGSLKQVFGPDVNSFVMDCEAVAWDRVKQCILPFQVLSTRKRKDVQTVDIEVQVCVFAFDLLYLNGEALTTKTLKFRREMLYKHFKEVPGIFSLAKHMESSNVEEIQTFLDLAVEGNCEGLMVKTLEHEASYEPSKRSRNWLKVKKDYLSGLGDTFDLVVIGGYIGRGKRTGVYGGYLLACYDDDREEYQSICKLGTGFSDEDLAAHTKSLNESKIDGPRSYYNWSDTPNLRPDVWFDPVQVWEIKAADLSISPVHKASMGLVDPNKGISLRFPRFIRIRDDKKPEDATNSTQVADFYRSQAINTSGNALEDC